MRVDVVRSVRLYWNPYIFVGYRNDLIVVSPYKSLYFEMLRNDADAHFSRLVYLWYIKEYHM